MPSARVFISCLKLSRAKAGTSGWFNGKFKETISPVLISLEAAALTLVGVKRFNLPICDVSASGSLATQGP